MEITNIFVAHGMTPAIRLADRKARAAEADGDDPPVEVVWLLGEVWFFWADGREEVCAGRKGEGRP